jgi:hypothetical protein
MSVSVIIPDGDPLFETTRQEMVLLDMIFAAEITLLPGLTEAMSLLIISPTFSQLLEGAARVPELPTLTDSGSDFRCNSLSVSSDIVLSFLF